MNSIARFRLCTLTDEELLQKVDDLTDKMYQQSKVPTRNVPARPNDDYDLLIGELLLRFDRRIKQEAKISPVDERSSQNG